MTTAVTFVLLREGQSDDGLVDLIGQLVSRASGLQADGVARDLKGSIPFPTYRARLLAGLGVDGPVRQLPSFQRLVHDIEEALAHE